MRARLKLYPVPTSTKLEGEAALAAAGDFRERADYALRQAELIVNPEQLDQEGGTIMTELTDAEFDENAGAVHPFVQRAVHRRPLAATRFPNDA